MKPFLGRHGGLAVLALLLLAFPLLRPDSFAYDLAIQGRRQPAAHEP